MLSNAISTEDIATTDNRDMVNSRLGLLGDVVATQRRLLKGQLSLDTLLAFVFGVIFVAAMLMFSVIVVNPSPEQFFIFKTVLALAAAGVGAMIPGQFEFRHLPFVRAGGAIAVFALVFLAPLGVASGVAKFKEPAVSEDLAGKPFLEKIDIGDYGSAYSLLDKESPKWFGISKAQFETLLSNSHKPFGKTERRQLVGQSTLTNPPQLPPGIFRFHAYRTKFQNARNCVPETVTFRATSDLKWEVFTYQIGMAEVPCGPTPPPLSPTTGDNQ